MSYGAPSPTAVNAVLASGYTPPSAAAVDAVLSRVGPDYGAPSSTAVDAVLTPGYTPPSATAVNQVLVRNRPPGTLYPVGIYSGDLGTPTISLRTLGPSSIASGGFGTASVFTTQIVVVSGWQSSAFGAAAIDLRDRALEVGGIAPPPLTGPDGDRQMPTPTIEYRTKLLVPEGIPIGMHPAPYIAHYYQFLDLAGMPSINGAIGTAFIAYRNRYIEPPFIASNIFGTALVARVQLIYPSGWESSDVPVGHQLDINLQRLQHHSVGTDPAGYGDTHIRNSFEFLRPVGIPERGVNFPIVFNRTQYIFAAEYEDTTGDPTTWPPYYPFVENRNRTVAPSGWTSSRFSAIGTLVDNKAVPILPDGLAATLWGSADVGHRIRYIPPASIFDGYISGYTHVRNNARLVVDTSAGDTALYGLTEVFNRNRTLVIPSVDRSDALGTAFIADRIRYAVVYPSYDPPYVPIPEVRHNPYSVSPPSLPAPMVGDPAVYEHFNRAFPSSANVHSVPWVGEPFIQNRNKTLQVFPSDQSSFGRAQVANFIRYIDVTLGQQIAWGSADISRRTKLLAPSSASVPVFTVLHRIRNVIPDPPVNQRVFVDGIFIGAYENPGIVPSPVLFPYYVRPAGINQGSFGTAVLTRNQISVGRGIFTLDQVGIPSVSGTQYCYPESFIESDKYWGAVRLSPHTIYAPSADQATQQAKDNHPLNIPHKIGELESPLSNWPIFGGATIANKNRTIGPVPTHRLEEDEVTPALHTRYGIPDIQLKNRRILAQSVRPGRFGFATILGGQQRIDLNDPSVGIAPLPIPTAHGIDPSIISSPVIYPEGFAPDIPPVPRVDLFNRVITPQGIPHRGNPEQDLTNPWGTALVGYPRVYTIGGGVLTLWGTARVEHRIRTVYAQGHDSLSLLDYTLGGFADRMRVSRRNPPGGIVGIPPGTMGAAVVTYGTRTVGATSVRGYASGAHSLAITIQPSGWLDTVFGDIDRWEAGTIKPYGPDMSSLGKPRMVHTLRPSGEDVSLLGSPRMARSVIIAGMPPVGFDGPYITDMTGCNNRIVVVLPIAAPTFISPVVGHA